MDQRIAAIGGLIVEVVEPVFPLVRDDDIGEARKKIRRTVARLERGLARLHDIQPERKPLKGFMPLQVDGIGDKDVANTGRILPIGRLTYQHRIEGGLHDIDIGLEDRNALVLRARRIAEAQPGRQFSDQLVDKE